MGGDARVTRARRSIAKRARRRMPVSTIAIENHQDLGSDELMAFAEEAGPNVGIALDTGNPFAVAEDPVAFASRVAPRIRHVHLKDYVSQFTPEGFRLIRCAIGDGCVPLQEIADVFFRPAGLRNRVPADRLNRGRRARRAAHSRLRAGLVGGISGASRRRASDRRSIVSRRSVWMIMRITARPGRSTSRRRDRRLRAGAVAQERRESEGARLDVKGERWIKSFR